MCIRDRVTTEHVIQAIGNYFDPSLLTTIQCGSLRELSDTSAGTPITLSFEAPSPSWNLEIAQIFEGEDSLSVIAYLNDSNKISPQVITTLSDTVYLDSPENEKPIRYYILGKSWNWTPKIKGAQFIKELSEIEPELKKASVLSFKR